MATRSFIAIKENGSYRAVYQHFDSYPSCLGKLLLEHYSDADKVREAISLGDASYWDENIHPPKGAIHNFDIKYPGVSVFYCRDRNQDLEISEYKTVKELVKDVYGGMIEYLYIFDKDINKWLFTSLRYKDIAKVFSSIKELKMGDCHA